MHNARPRQFLQLAAALSLSPSLALAVATDDGKPVSYFKQIRPIFQAHCQGCHQPAKAKGGYVMTDFAKLLKGGEECAKDGTAAVTPGAPEKSMLIEQITPYPAPDGKGVVAEMPPKKAPLAEPEIALIKRW